MELTAFWSSEARVRAILEGASNTFVGLDLHGRVAAVSWGAEKLFGVPAPYREPQLAQVVRSVLSAATRAATES